jgi:4a-hydroxytetrahydrobiopterin dehydratase
MTVPGWGHGADGLQRSFRFTDFNEAFAFMTRVALLAERMRHHPDWSNTYDRVHIVLRTHDAGGAVTEKDLAMARAINALFS